MPRERRKVISKTFSMEDKKELLDKFLKQELGRAAVEANANLIIAVPGKVSFIYWECMKDIADKNVTMTVGEMYEYCLRHGEKHDKAGSFCFGFIARSIEKEKAIRDFLKD